MTLIKPAVLLLAFIACLPAQYDRFGAPACSSADQEHADRSFFVLCHSSSRKVALWVGYELKPEHLHGRASRPTHFRHDTYLSGPSADDADYKYSGFSRGHMAPAADFVWSNEAMRTTFLLSNAVPQQQNVNAGAWAQLEAAVRRLAAISDVVYVVTGPIFESEDTEVIGAGRVAVPSHTYKVILAVRGDRRTMYAAIIPNTAGVRGRFEDYATTVENVERRTGLDFFDALEDADERQLEAALAPFPKKY